MGKGVDHKQCPVLARHRERRARGVPTLSVLVGDVDVAQWCWMRWQRAEASAFVCSNAMSGDAVLGEWLSSSAPALSGAPRSLAEIEAATRAALPGLLALPPRSTSSGDLSSLLSTLLRIAETVPRIELACALSEAQFVRWRLEADANELQLVAEGLIGVEPVAREPEASAARRPRSNQRRAALSRDAASAAVPRLEYDADDFMRSRAERASTRRSST
ncbi:MAG TPA: hypothetical protein VNN80_35110 [Polyangiaceae bacterium]|nr:hypothetical protein [Polyangiaceae bacterium]